MATIRTADEIAEETLVGLMLSGDAEVFRFLDADPSDFAHVTYRAIAGALSSCASLACDIPLNEVIDLLDDYGLVEDGQFGLPLSWYCELLARAVERTNRAMDRDGMTMREAVTALSLRVKVAAANRWDEMTGALVVSEILTLDTDRLTPDEIAETLMHAGGAGADYLSRFKESARGWVVSCLMEAAGEKVLVGA